MRKGVAFDAEGTAVSLEDYHFDAFIRAAEEFGLRLTFETITQRIPRAVGGGDSLISQGIAKLLGKPGLALEILKRKREIYLQALNSLSLIELRPGFAEALEEIKKLDLPVAISSLTLRTYSEIIFAKSGLAELFPLENQVFETDVKSFKPAPDCWRETARRMGIEPGEQVVFEDSSTGITAVRAAGSTAVAVPFYQFKENIHELIEAGAVRIFWDWREINVSAMIKNLQKTV